MKEKIAENLKEMIDKCGVIASDVADEVITLERENLELFQLLAEMLSFWQTENTIIQEDPVTIHKGFYDNKLEGWEAIIDRIKGKLSGGN